MTTVSRAGAAVALTAALVAAGCGGGGDNRLSQSEFQQKADAICQKSRNEILPASKNVKTLTDVKKYAGVAAFSTAAELKALQGLKPPKDKEATFKQAQAFLADQGRSAQALYNAAAANDAAKAKQVLAGVQQKTAQGKALGQQLGLKVCGQGG